jgi:hypothetical protein
MKNQFSKTGRGVSNTPNTQTVNSRLHAVSGMPKNAHKSPLLGRGDLGVRIFGVGIFLALTLLFTSCRKDDGGAGVVNGGTWTFKNISYSSIATTGASSGSGYGLSAVDSKGNGFTLIFASQPTADATYDITDMFTPALGTEGTVGVMVNEKSTQKIYRSDGAENLKATITVSKGKITATIPEITVYDTAQGSTESGKTSGKLIQTI